MPTKSPRPTAAKKGAKPIPRPAPKAAAPKKSTAGAKATAKPAPKAAPRLTGAKSAPKPPRPAPKTTTPPKAAPKPAAKPAAPSAKTAPKPPVPAPVPLPRPIPTGPTPGAYKPPAKPTVPLSASTAKPLPVVAPKPATPKPTSLPAVKGRTEPAIPPEKDISARNKPGTVKDRIVLMVPDPHWVHAVWELSLQSVQRAEAALGFDWHSAKPIIRLFDVTSTDTTSTSSLPVRDIAIHGGCNHWYIDVPQPPRSYRADIGYLSKRGQFHVIARSNVVTPPKAGTSETMEDGWAAEVRDQTDADRILAMSGGFESPAGPPQVKELFDEQFRRPIKEGAFGAGAAPGKLKKFFFDIDASLIVVGRTDPTAKVTIQNEPVALKPDGSFAMRLNLLDSRQIYPAVATSADGLEEQTIVLAVERNIRRLDPMIHDMYGEQ